MEVFRGGQLVRLRNRVRGTLLRADDDGVGVSLSPRGASPDDATWEVCLVLREGFTYVLLGVRGSDRFLSVSPAPRGERRVVQAQRRYDGEVLWRATWVGRRMRQRRYVLLRHAFLGVCLRADGRVAGVSVDHPCNDCAMMHWVVEARADASAAPPSSSVPVWAPVFRAGEADGGLSSSWLPLMDSRGGLVSHLPGNLVGGAAQVLRDGRGHLQVHADAAASLVRAAWDRVGRDLRAGVLLVVVPGEVARLAAARRFLAAGRAFLGAQRALWPRAAVLLPLQLAGDGNAPGALGRDQEAAPARARTPRQEAGPVGDPAAVQPGPGAPAAPAPAARARGPQQLEIAARPGRRIIRKARNALFAYKPDVEEPAGAGGDDNDDEEDEDLPPSSAELRLSQLSTLEHGMLRRQRDVRDFLQELGELQIRAERGTGCSDDEVPVKQEIRRMEDAIITTIKSYNLMVPLAEEAKPARISLTTGQYLLVPTRLLPSPPRRCSPRPSAFSWNAEATRRTRKTGALETFVHHDII